MAKGENRIGSRSRMEEEKRNVVRKLWTKCALRVRMPSQSVACSTRRSAMQSSLLELLKYDSLIFRVLHLEKWTRRMIGGNREC